MFSAKHQTIVRLSLSRLVGITTPVPENSYCGYSEIDLYGIPTGASSDHTGWRSQMQTQGLSTNWVNVDGSTGTNEITIPINPDKSAAFFRLIYP